MSRRREDNCIPGFNIVVLDVDDGFTIETVSLLMKDYTFLIHTTKRHTEKQHRFRIILPLSHVIKLNAPDYKEFMNSLYDWLPFDVDRQTNQRSRKWLANLNKDRPAFYNDGELIDALLFIPKTKKAEDRKEVVTKLGSLSNLERWFIENIETGNRSNQLVKFAFALVDAGQSFEEIKDRLTVLNGKLKDGLSETEIMTTIMMSVAKKIHIRDTQQNE